MIVGFALALLAARAPTATVLVEAESFKKPGGWVLDTQFIETLGAPCLTCPCPSSHAVSQGALVGMIEQSPLLSVRVCL